MRLAGKTLTEDIFISSWVGFIRKLSKDDFTTAFDKWLHLCKKYIQIQGSYIEKY